MQKLLKTICYSVICVFVFAMTHASFAAENARGATTRSRGTTATSRMPSIPILPVSATGIVTVSSDVIDPDEPTPGPTPPTPGPTPQPEPTCPDGGVMNSEYTVLNCMNDIQACINGGALPNGINSLYNEELRDAIVNGMGLCIIQVENCIAKVRVNCQNVYESSADVWLDFNARKVQPSYYAFVLRQTGLTPTQAKNTCLLLDRNTYGSSFNAVGTEDWVNSEYAQKTGAYNKQQDNSLIKKNPQGATVNNDGWSDAKRGYYARWDAEQAECLLRVAAYNKDDLITNEWLFGLFGDNTPAEVWQTTGSTFTCNKDLFGFALRNKTKNMAVLGIGGGTLVGAGVGALAGHGATDNVNCEDEKVRAELLKQIKDNKQVGTLNMYLADDILSNGSISSTQCEAILELKDKMDNIMAELDRCLRESGDPCAKEVGIAINEFLSNSANISGDALNAAANDVIQAEKNNTCRNKTADTLISSCRFRPLYTGTKVRCDKESDDCVAPNKLFYDIANLKSVFAKLTVLNDGQENNRWKTALAGAGIGAAAGGAATAITAFVERSNISCHVGDDLERVGLNKSYTIGRLRDYYVKWALNLPNTPAPTAVVTNCENWSLSCNLFTDLNECQAAQFNYRPGNLTTTQLITSPCKVSGSACIADLNTAHQYGLCQNAFTTVNNCDQWRNECSKFTNATSCNAAQFYYAPMSATVSNACTYALGGNSCQMNSSVAGQYVNMATCSTPATPEEPAQK